MRKILLALISAIAVFFMAKLILAQAATPAPALVALPKVPPQALILTPTPPEIEADAYILIDANSNRILASKNPDEHLPPASLTKLMTMYVVSAALQANRFSLDDNVGISAKAAKKGGSKMFLRPGEQVKVKDLVQGIIVDSGNDACIAMAEYVAGSESAFASLMNQQAAALGLHNTHFVDSTGLPNKNHYSTARDMATLAQAVIQHFPQDYDWYKQKYFTFNKIKQMNRNRLLWWDNTVDGLKTGHTSEAGYCLVSSANRQGMRLIAVVMGTKSDKARAIESQKLLNYGYRFYETHRLYQAGTQIVNPRVWKGINKHVPLGIADDFYVTVPAGQFKFITVKKSIEGPLYAPIDKGKSYGALTINLAGQDLSTLPLIALNDDPRGGVWRRFSDAIGYTWHKWFGKEAPAGS